MDAEARKEEILAKKAKLEELRRARALREQEMRKNRQSAGEASDVSYSSDRKYNIDLHAYS